MENKSLARLDIKSLYTNIPVNKCIKRLTLRKKLNKKHLIIFISYSHIMHETLLFSI